MNDLLNNIVFLNIYTLFLLSVYNIISEACEKCIIKPFGLEGGKKIAFWVILAIISFALLFYFDKLDLIVDCKHKKHMSAWEKLKEQLLIGLIFIVFWRALYSIYDGLFDLFFKKKEAENKVTIVMINVFIAVVSFCILLNSKRLDLIFKSKVTTISES